jgi:hypothetical protein
MVITLNPSFSEKVELLAKQIRTPLLGEPIQCVWLP